MSRPYPSRSSGPPPPRLNGKIRAREVRVIGQDNQQVGILSLGDAIRLAQSQGVDLVEIVPNATPPVCRLVDYGKFRFEQSKKGKAKQSARPKEIQLRSTIDQHDFDIKLSHAAEFLSAGVQVKVVLRFRGREMLHQEFGRQVIERFVNGLAEHGRPDAPPQLMGRVLNVMVRPLARQHRAQSSPPPAG